MLGIQLLEQLKLLGCAEPTVLQIGDQFRRIGVRSIDVCPLIGSWQNRDGLLNRIIVFVVGS